MVKLTYVSDKDFVSKDVEYPDFQYQLAIEIAELVQSWVGVLPDAEGRKLIMIAQDKTQEISRCDQERGVGKYRITIEPII